MCLIVSPAQCIWEDVVRAKYRSKIDLADAYGQIRVEQKDVPKTAFATIYGTYVSNIMQQGDCNAPATFQRLMTYIFRDVIGVCIHVYLDDIFIYSDTIKDHEKHVELVFERLKREKLYLKWEKCDLYSKSRLLRTHNNEKGNLPWHGQVSPHMRLEETKELQWGAEICWTHKLLIEFSTGHWHRVYWTINGHHAERYTISLETITSEMFRDDKTGVLQSTNSQTYWSTKQWTDLGHMWRFKDRNRSHVWPRTDVGHV